MFKGTPGCRVERFVIVVVFVGAFGRVAGAGEIKVNSDLSAVVKGNNAFALDLYAHLARQEGGNLFFSPYSVSSALTMTAAGARGETAEEMAQVLQLRLPEKQLHPAFASLAKNLRTDGKQKGYQLQVANRLWGQAGYGFLPKYLQLTREHYGAELAQVDFVQHTDQSRKRINDWVEDQTQKKIKDLIPPGVLNSLTRLVLTNAIYFKGDWTEKFDQDATKHAPFKISTQGQVEAPLMHQTEDFRYGQFEELQVLELPYGEEKHLSMIVLLPLRVDGLSDLERKLTVENWAKWIAGLRTNEVRVYLPKFTMKSQVQLNRVLQSMGMRTAFVAGQADFSGLSTQEDLFLSAAIHQAFVDVNEEGTEAAAATGIVISATALPAEPIVFRADHPFVFVIRDNRTGSMLFLGRLLDPRA